MSAWQRHHAAHGTGRHCFSMNRNSPHHTTPRHSGNSCSRLCDDAAVAGLDWGASVTWLMVIGVRQYIPKADPLMRIEAYRELVHAGGGECQAGAGD
ncbi:hypothetical protein E2C01_056350 [Portunus trituberculatus]|uniref:Uncharacterized protein n=1 Tax=Portunus trituberculatus TaxID=210409 RepID=A0A5B7GYX1_PORTR|nr:hypothetical protein [Portunus trituberculatus]